MACQQVDFESHRQELIRTETAAIEVEVPGIDFNFDVTDLNVAGIIYISAVSVIGFIIVAIPAIRNMA